MPPRRADRDYEQSAAWGEIRDAARDSVAHGESYTVAVGAVVHTVADLDELAAVTRRERLRWGVRWPEDGASR